MYMKHSFAALAVAVLLFASAGTRAADEVTDTFNPKINAWAEGTILSLDADGKFTIRGVQRPYQTEYAKMLKDIHDKTMKFSGAERDSKEADIRKSYANALNKAAQKEPSKESDFSFRVNSKDGSLSVFDETSHYNVPHDSNPTPPARLNDTQRAAMMTLKDLHVGDYVVVGYASGVINNDAFVVIKGNKMGTATSSSDLKVTGSPEPVATPSPKTGDKLKLDAQTEQMRQIRKRIVEDKNLSTAAHNVMLKVTEDGKAHLSGTVKSDAEKTAVENHAAEVVGKDHVMSGLDVKP